MVRMLRLSRIVRTARQALGRTGSLLMKLDIEGSEWSVLPDLMQTGALCQVSGTLHLPS